MIGKTGKNPPFTAVERRKLPLQTCKKPKTRRFYPSKVPVIQ
jgi:hypothetical protein